MRPTVHEYAVLLAEAAAARSEDPHRKVGAALLDRGGAVLALGYNGPPSGVDLPVETWADRELVRALTVHAEANALRYVRPRQARLLASTRMPCGECVKAAASYGIRTIVYRERTRDGGPWDPAEIISLAESLGVDLVQVPQPWRPE